ISARIDHASLDSAREQIALEAATLDARGSVQGAGGRRAGALHAELVAPRLSGRWDTWRAPAGLLPVRAALDADVATGPPRLERVALAIESGALGRLEATGGLRFPERGGQADLRLSWRGADLGRLAALAREAGVALPSGLAASGAISAEGTLSGS